MSEAFDPEKVERFEADTTPKEGTSRIRNCVLAAEFDKLLALYRQLQDPRCTCGHKQASHYPGGCAVNVRTPNGVRGCTCPEFTLKQES